MLQELKNHRLAKFTEPFPLIVEACFPSYLIVEVKGKHEELELYPADFYLWVFHKDLPLTYPSNNS
jgi:hypothetical protein